MSRLDDVQRFIDLSRTLTRPEDLDALLQSITKDMGFDHYALLHHVDLTPFEHELGHMAKGQLIGLSDYPEEWIAEYISDNIVSDDPVLLASHRTNVGFKWSEIPTLIELRRPHIEKIERGKRAGIGDGFTVPSNVPGEANGSCNFAIRTGRELPLEQLMMAQLVGSYAFQAARSIVTHARSLGSPKTRLTSRQLECIVLVAQGKTDWEISKILGISETTVKDYVGAVLRRYGVSKRVQAVLRAIYDGHFSLRDVLR